MLAETNTDKLKSLSKPIVVKAQYVRNSYVVALDRQIVKRYNINEDSSQFVQSLIEINGRIGIFLEIRTKGSLLDPPSSSLQYSKVI